MHLFLCQAWPPALSCSTMCSAQTFHPEGGCLGVSPCCTSPGAPWWAADILLTSPCRRAALRPSAPEPPEECFSMLSPIWGLCSFLCACLGRDNSPVASPGFSPAPRARLTSRDGAGKEAVLQLVLSTAPRGKAGCPVRRTSDPEGNASQLSIPLIWY